MSLKPRAINPFVVTLALHRHSWYISALTPARQKRTGPTRDHQADRGIGAVRGWGGTSDSTETATATTVGWDRVKQELHEPQNIEELTS